MPLPRATAFGPSGWEGQPRDGESQKTCPIQQRSRGQSQVKIVVVMEKICAAHVWRQGLAPLIAALLWAVPQVVLGQATPADSVDAQLNIDPVVITGTGTAHQLKNAPVQTEVIHREVIERYGSAPLTSILSGLIPSFDFSRSDMGTALQMGGLGGSYILILVDGKRLTANVSGQPDLDLIDPASIDHIEVVKGAASALYGSDAIAGVINIITKKQPHDFSITNTTRLGSYMAALQSNTLQWTLGPFRSLTSFMLKHSDGWQNTTCEDPNRYEHPITNSVNKTSNEYTDWKIAQHLYWNRPSYALYAQGDYYRKDIHRPTGVPDYKTYDFRYQNASAALGGKVLFPGGHQLLADFSYSMHAYYYVYTGETWSTYRDGKGKEISFPYQPGNVSLESNAQRAEGIVKGIVELPYANRLSVGLQAEYDWLIAPQRLDANPQGDVVGAAFAQDEWSPTKNFNLTAGLRVTANKAFKARLTPKVSLRWKIAHFTLRAAYAEGFKLPTIKELHYRYIRQMASVILNMGKPDLNPQTSRYVSASLEYAIPRFEVNLTGYANFLDQMITMVTIPIAEAPGDLVVTYAPTKVRQYRNMDDARTYGLDCNLRLRIVDKLTLRASYSFLQTTAHLFDDDNQVMRRVIIDGTANHRATWGLEWFRSFFHQRYRLSLALFGRAQSTRYYQDDGNGKPYHLWRINTQHDFNLPHHWGLSLGLGVDNILNYYETTYHHLHYGTYTPGRTFYGALTIRFGKDAKLPAPATMTRHASSAPAENPGGEQ